MSKPCRRFSAHVPMPRWRSVCTLERGLRIVNCGDFCGDLSYISASLATSQINLPHPVNWLNLRGLQGFLPSVQQLSFLARNGLRNQKSLAASKGTHWGLCIRLILRPIAWLTQPYRRMWFGAASDGAASTSSNRKPPPCVNSEVQLSIASARGQRRTQLLRSALPAGRD